MATNNTMISELPISQKLDGSHDDTWKRKIQYLLNERDLLEHLTVVKFSPSDQDKDGKLIDTYTMQYQESLQAYQDQSKKDRRACFTVLYSMHNDLIGKFKICPMAKGVWDQPKIHFGQTSETSVLTLQLKWMKYKMNFSCTMAEHL